MGTEIRRTRRHKSRHQSRAWKRLALVSFFCLSSAAPGPSTAWKIRFPGRGQRQEHQQSEGDMRLVDAFFEHRMDPSLLTHVLEASSATVKEYHQIDDVSPRQLIDAIYKKFIDVLWYKPPVGIVALAVTLRLLWTGRLFAWDQNKKQPTVDSLFAKQQSLQRHGRALKMDKDDVNYRNFGGVERVRGGLLWAALVDLMPSSDAQQTHDQSSRKNLFSADSTADESTATAGPSSVYSFRETVLRVLSGGDSDAGSNTTSTTKPTVHPLLPAIVDALRVTAHPRQSRTHFALELVPHLARIEHLLEHYDTSLTVGVDTKNSTITADQLYKLLGLASTTVEVRAMDALLRVCRDRLLKTTFRLARTAEHWQRHLQQRPIWMQRLFGSIDSDRARLSYAQAAYEAEVRRLGRVTALLMRRPTEMKDEVLVNALKCSQEEMNRTEASAPETKWKLGSNLIWRWRANGQLGFSFHKMDAGHIYAPSALEALLQHDSDQTAWEAVAQQWSQEVRTSLCQVVRESLEGSSSVPSELNTMEFTAIERQWCNSHHDAGKVEDRADQWRTVLRYVDSLPLWRRVGEGQVVRLKDAAIVSWTRRVDFLGIPSSLLYVMGAHRLHKWILPYWPSLKADLIDAVTKGKEIFVTRAWVPLKGIYDDIMNKSPGMMSAFGLEVEQQSLDHMLRDLGFGDGSPNTRQEALKGATEQYEHDLKSGLLVNFAKGRLVRLLLVQVQQLKVGLLSALDTIDVLMRGNKIHFQVLAAIPAVVIATYGTRLFVRALYNIRAKDLRPVTVVHGEMARYLAHMEHLILSPTEERTAAALGELVLTIYRYLILLDFSSPPFPAAECDQIHTHLQSLLVEAAEGRRPLDRIDRIQRRHQDLLKSL